MKIFLFRNFNGQCRMINCNLHEQLQGLFQLLMWYNVRVCFSFAPLCAKRRLINWRRRFIMRISTLHALPRYNLRRYTRFRTSAFTFHYYILLFVVKFFIYIYIHVFIVCLLGWCSFVIVHLLSSALTLCSVIICITCT